MMKLLPIPNPNPYNNRCNAEVMPQEEDFSIQYTPENGYDGNGVS